ncbi:unnamed protein product [Acanthosepion pharaonis]|uniref:Protein FAM136A n=1 Tax=Acanthosepion pharaonis TaxID=158019 RepID=A0A812D203_ACAPH|nr:unnamed protein product [Sepia pharaonis]
MISQLDQEHLRKMQGEMYRCGAKCCDQQNLSMDEVHRCIDRCSEPVNRAQALIQNEIQMFQDRLQRCALACQDQVRDKMSPGATEADISRYRHELESCILRNVLRCCEMSFTGVAFKNTETFFLRCWRFHAWKPKTFLQPALPASYLMSSDSRLPSRVMAIPF